MASFDDVAKRLVLYDQRVEVKAGEPVPVSGNGEDIAFADSEPLRVECEAFLAAIGTRRAPITDSYSGLQVLKVLQAAQRSLVMNGDPVQLSVERYNANGVPVYV